MRHKQAIQARQLQHFTSHTTMTTSLMSRTYLLCAFVALVLAVTRAQTARFDCPSVRDFGVSPGAITPQVSFRCAQSVTVGNDSVTGFNIALTPSSAPLVQLITARVVAGVSSGRPLMLRYVVDRSSTNGLCDPSWCRKLYSARIN